MGTAVIFSLALLAAVALAFLVPWELLPAWMSVLVPLAATGWALALTLAAGAVSGVGLVVLIPLIWTALFHRPWESACILAAIVAAEIVLSIAQSVPDAVTVRRVVLWAALGGLLAVATHGLRARIRRSQQASAQLHERLRELTIVEDRDRLAAALQNSVVQRVFAAGLKLQGVLSLSAGPRCGGRWSRPWPISMTLSACSGRRSSAWSTGWTGRACGSGCCSCAANCRRYLRSPSPGPWTLPWP